MQRESNNGERRLQWTAGFAVLSIVRVFGPPPLHRHPRLLVALIGIAEES
jgi:hypothetical protein